MKYLKVQQRVESRSLLVGGTAFSLSALFQKQGAIIPLLLRLNYLWMGLWFVASSIH